VNRTAGVDYAEVVAAIASKSAGPGTRATWMSSPKPPRKHRGRRRCEAGKAIIILKPADPPIHMTDTVLIV
jgi:acetaldehyde dehydrogenase